MARWLIHRNRLDRPPPCYVLPLPPSRAHALVPSPRLAPPWLLARKCQDVELVCCQFGEANDLYFWNSCWFIQQYRGGDTFWPNCRSGCSVLWRAHGISRYSSDWQLMILTPAEHTVRGILHREASCKAFTIAAVNIISL